MRQFDLSEQCQYFVRHNVKSYFLMLQFYGIDESQLTYQLLVSFIATLPVDTCQFIHPFSLSASGAGRGGCSPYYWAHVSGHNPRGLSGFPLRTGSSTSGRWPDASQGSGVFILRVLLILWLFIPETACGF